MRRRDFMTLVGGAATAWPLAARAQQVGKVWRVGMLDTASRELNSANMGVFLEKLREYGYVEGKNLTIDYRSAGGRNERLPELVAQLIGLNPDVVVLRGTPEALAVKQATSTIPVVMSAVVDPVGIGVAASLPHPGGNFTGMSSVVYELEAKRLGILKEVVPGMKRMAVLGDHSNPAFEMEWQQGQIAARSLMIDAILFDVRSAADVSHAFDVAVSEKLDALLVKVDGTTRPNRQLIIDLAAIHKLPAIYSAREFVNAGGLFAYAVSYVDLYRRAASLVEKVFRGAKPSELPIEAPTKFELVLNLNTARALGLTFPPGVLAIADDVIE
ncbi:ABC transporter substrate-binding protein [Bradyrhizobium sp. Gha]|uniref:ABC transporter substrate-binding protein n=1 Tax=Bradyrhizobium sp. Gha TaxID=1855318 RepID=UPI0008E5A1BF|nr:ABC transporter substrate-binding protein [Bradyrhizobium sp. Gha]SFK25764.1 putative ABC transport system substrate-binding protein [Bradyrhizobium sp. Gha]